MLKPAPSDYRKTIYYNTYDVTANMTDSFAVGIILGNGKYFAPRQDKPYKNTTFGLPKCRMNIIVEYADGTTQRLVTDEKWRVTANGPIRANNEYDGEEYDARRELDGWLTTNYDDSNWLPAQRTAIPQGTLRAQMMEGMVEGGKWKVEGGVHYRENLDVAVVVHRGCAVGLQVERVDHVHIVKVGCGSLVSDIDGVFQRQVPHGERLELSIAGTDAALVLVVELTEADGHLAAAGTRSRNDDQLA